MPQPPPRRARCGTREGDVLTLRWSERADGAAPPLRTGTGQGHRLIERALRSQRGDLRIEWLDDGLEVTFSLPVVQTT